MIEEKTAGSEAVAAAQTQQEQETATGKGQVDASGKPVAAVKVYAPFQVYFEGMAYSVSAVNETGPFDILPRHHNFLCICFLVVEFRNQACLFWTYHGKLLPIAVAAIPGL